MVFANVSTMLFAPESPRPWALMRIVLACTLLVDAGARWPYCVELYSSAGFTFPAFPGDVFHPFALSPLATLTLHSLLIVLLGFLLVGWYSRLCAVTSFLLLGCFSLLDASGTLTKYTAIALHVLLLMSFAQPGGVWSIDAWRRKKNRDAVPLAPAWPRHLLCLLVASIYLGAAITKIRLPDFATGDLLEFSLLDDAYGGRYPGFWLATQPKRLVLASYAVILFELLFPFLIWVPTLRRGLLVAGFVFHTALAAMMHLAMFSPVMIAALFAFMRESDLRFLSPRKGNRSKKARSLGGNPSSASWIDMTENARSFLTRSRPTRLTK